MLIVSMIPSSSYADNVILAEGGKDPNRPLRAHTHICIFSYFRRTVDSKFFSVHKLSRVRFNEFFIFS